MTLATAKFIKARFASVCPQCKARLAAGAEIGVTHDKVWRCVRCTNMFDEIGPEARDANGRLIVGQAHREARNARVLEIQNRYGLKHTFAPKEVK